VVAAPWYGYADGDEHPLFNASPFAQRDQWRYKQVLARYPRYQRSLSPFLIPFYTAVPDRRGDMYVAAAHTMVCTYTLLYPHSIAQKVRLDISMSATVDWHGRQEGVRRRHRRST